VIRNWFSHFTPRFWELYEETPVYLAIAAHGPWVAEGPVDAFPFLLTVWALGRGVLSVRFYGQRGTGLPNLLGFNKLPEIFGLKPKLNSVDNII